MSWGWGEGYGGAIRLLGTLQPPLFPFERSFESHLLAFMWVFLSVIARFPKTYLALRVICSIDQGKSKGTLDVVCVSQ